MDIQHELQHIRHELHEMGGTIMQRQASSQDVETLTTSLNQVTTELDRVLEELGLWVATTPMGERITLRFSFQGVKSLEYQRQFNTKKKLCCTTLRVTHTN